MYFSFHFLTSQTQFLELNYSEKSLTSHETFLLICHSREWTKMIAIDPGSIRAITNELWIWNGNTRRSDNFIGPLELGAMFSQLQGLS